MSQLGQKRKSGDPIATSDLPLKADINGRDCDVRFVQELTFRRMSVCAGTAENPTGSVSIHVHTR